MLGKSITCILAIVYLCYKPHDHAADLPFSYVDEGCGIQQNLVIAVKPYQTT